MRTTVRPRLGNLLVERGHLRPAELERALAVQREQNGGRSRLGRIAVELGYVSEADLGRAVARQHDVPFVDLGETTIDAGMGDVLEPEAAHRLRVLPIRLERGRLVVAMADPGDVVARDDAGLISNLDVTVVAASEDDLEDGLRRYRSFDRSLSRVLEEAAPPDTVALPARIAEPTALVRALDSLLERAVRLGASDIHLEPREDGVAVRYRVDGMLQDAGWINKARQSSAICRIKVMAEMDIAETRKPQDGRATVHVDDYSVDLRIATLPSQWGEKIVIRVLPGAAAGLELQRLGFGAHLLEEYLALLTRPYGAVLVTGPTGSGKSRTLYASLEIIDRVHRGIVTVEDPIESKIPGITQIQVDERIGVTFAAALRSIMRADPDVVMIGEIRDVESATIAVEAALTGHLVLSTLHTNDAASALVRLVDIGVESFLVASAVDVVIAQRLLRRLCTRCRRPESLALTVAARRRFPGLDGQPAPVLYQPTGCAVCRNTGYRGRTAILELLRVTEEIGRMVIQGASAEEIKRVAVAWRGMRTLLDDGLVKVRTGVTSLEELLRVMGDEEDTRAGEAQLWRPGPDGQLRLPGM